MAEIIISQLDRAFANPLETNRQVNFISDRDAISALKRWEGMQVYVKSELTTFELRGGILNEHWIDISGIDSANYTPTGGYAGTAQDIVDSIETVTGGIENISITHIANLDYYVVADPYKINSEYYSASPTTVTLTVGDATNARIDVIYADVDGLIGVLSGTPSATPVKPIVSNTQRELTFRTVPALATVDPVVTNELVFDENVGVAGGEFAVDGWNLTALNFNSTAVSFSGTKSIYFDGVDPYFNVDFKNDVNIAVSGISTFFFRVYVTEVLDRNISFFFQCLDTSFIATGTYRAVKDGLFGFDRNVLNTWQLISIPIAFFNLPVTEIKGIRFMVSTIKKPKMYLDTLTFQSNVTQPTPTIAPINFLQLTDTDNSYAGHAGKVPTVNVEETGLGFDIIPENLSNKKTDIEANKLSDVFYAPIKPIVDWVTSFFDGISEPKNIIVCDGDSRTAGYTGGVNYKYSDNLDLGTDFVINNTATGGATLTDNEISSVRWIVKDAFNIISRKKSKLATNNIVVIWAGYNDMSIYNKSAEIVFESLKSYCFSRKKEGWKVIVCTEPNNTNAIGEERRLVLNDLIRKNVFEIADGIADIGNSEFLGGVGDASNPIYFFDGVHMTAAGYAQVALMVKNEILNLTQNNYKRLSADTTVVGDLASSTVETSPLLSLLRPYKDGTSFANMAAFFLGRYAGVGGAFEPFTKLDIKLKSTSTQDLLTDKTVMSFKDNGDVIIQKLTSTLKKYTKTETDGTLTNANLTDEGVNCKMIDGRLYFQESGQITRSIGIVAGTATLSIYDETWSFGLLEISPEGFAKFFKSVQVGDNTAVASASNVGAIRYRVSGNNSYAEMCMQNGASSYIWETLTVHSW